MVSYKYMPICTLSYDKDGKVLCSRSGQANIEVNGDVDWDIAAYTPLKILPNHGPVLM